MMGSQQRAPAAPRGRTRVSVIIPTYNEAGNIIEMIDRLHRALAGQSHEIVIVDDDSPDGTWQRARQHCAGDPSVTVMRRVGVRGLASAVLDGMAAAEGDALAVIDGDLQHDESVLPQMVESVLDGGAEVCVGTRAGGAGSFGHRARSRRWVTAAGTAFARRVLPQLRSTRDPLSGFFVVSRSLYERAAPRGSSGLMEYKVLWAFLACKSEVIVDEVAYDFRPRVSGETKLSGAVLLDDFVNALSMRLGPPVLPVLVKYCILGVAGVAVSLVAFILGELAGLPAIRVGIAPDFDPVHVSVLAGIQAGTVTNFAASHYFRLYRRRYRGWGLVGGLALFEAVSVAGVSVHLALLPLLRRSGFLVGVTNGEALAAINNGIVLAVAAITNFLLIVAITWNRLRPLP